MGIELKDFIAETLTQIIEGVRTSQSLAKDDKTRAEIIPTSLPARADSQIVGASNVYINLIEFDIAVTATEGAKTDSKVGVLVTVIGAAVQGQTDVSSSTVSRIKFTLPVKLPRHNSGL